MLGMAQIVMQRLVTEWLRHDTIWEAQCACSVSLRVEDELVKTLATCACLGKSDAVPVRPRPIYLFKSVVEVWNMNTTRRCLASHPNSARRLLRANSSSGL